MSENIKKAIEELEDQLQVKQKEVSSLKQTINLLSKQIGEEPPYEDAEQEMAPKSGKGLRADAFFGKSPITASREFLEYKRVPCKPEEILDGLNKGGFDFDGFDWKDEKSRLRNLAISLSKNTAIFTKLPNGGFGLTKWYPEMPKKKAVPGAPGKKEGAVEPVKEEEAEKPAAPDLPGTTEKKS